MKTIIIFFSIIIILNTNSSNLLNSKTLELYCSNSVYAYGNGFFSNDDKFYYYSELNPRSVNPKKYIAIRSLENCSLVKTIGFHAFDQDDVFDFNLQNLDLHKKMIFVVLNKLYFYDFQTNTVVDSIEETATIQQLSVSVYQDKIAYFTTEKDSLHFKIFNLNKKEFEESFTLKSFYNYNKVYFSPDLEKIYFTGNHKDAMNSYLTIWSINNHKQDTTIYVSPRKISNLAASNDSKYLLLSAEDGKVYVINKFNYLVEDVIDHGNLIAHLKFMKNPNYCFIGSNTDKGKISIYSLIEQKEIFSSTEFHDGSDFRLSSLNNYLIVVFFNSVGLEMNWYKLNISGVSGIDDPKVADNEPNTSNDFKIFDIYGKIIKSGTNFNQSYIENLNSGIYFINEKFSKNGSHFRKIIVTK